MIIAYKSGILTATAEDIADIELLLSLNKKPASATPKPTSKGGNRWKGKHKQPCPICTKQFKNLKVHLAWHARDNRTRGMIGQSLASRTESNG
jgi:hypothetical protein